MTAVIVELKNKNLKRKLDDGEEEIEKDDQVNQEPCKKPKDQICSSSSSSQ